MDELLENWRNMSLLYKGASPALSTLSSPLHYINVDKYLKQSVTQNDPELFKYTPIGKSIIWHKTFIHDLMINRILWWSLGHLHTGDNCLWEF